MERHKSEAEVALEQAGSRRLSSVTIWYLEDSLKKVLR